MNFRDIATRSFITTKNNKYLWALGLFAAGGGASFNYSTTEGQPEWLVPVLIGVGILGLILGAIGVLTEGALIQAVYSEDDGKPLTIKESLRLGRHTFWRFVGIKTVYGLTSFALFMVVAGPALLGVAELLPLYAGLALSFLLALLSIPFFLTVYFVYQYALRLAAFDALGPIEALKGAKNFLHGRLLETIKLSVLAYAGQFGGGALTMSAALPGVLIGVALYFTAGLVPAVIVGALLVAPLVIPLAGAVAVFSSSVWTLGYKASVA